jgi:ADP-ribose pyrophosphatase YjhB (NUDIX family)
MPVEAWSPIVYGRTVRADSWWRAVPAGLPHQAWLGTLVSAIISGGDRLDRPRFLLARLNGYWVTGVACMASELSDEFASDGRRPLYTFVGWSAPLGASNLPPALDDMRGSYRDWAGPLYEEWVGLDWDEHASKVREPHTTTPQAQPWPQSEWADRTDEKNPDAHGAANLDSASPAGPTALSAKPGEIELWPAADEDRLWQAGLESQHAFVLAVGWAGVHQVPRSTLTHAAVDGLPLLEQVPAEPGGLDLASTAMPGSEAMTQGTPSQARPHLTIDSTVSAESFIANFRPGAWKDRLPGLGGEDLAQTSIRIRILIVTSDNRVLVVESDKGIALPYGMVRRRESPSAACKRIARESLGLELSRATPVSLTHFAKNNLLSIIFSCCLTSDHAQVRTQQEASVALRSLDDAALPAAIKVALDRLETGVENPAYRERE